MECSDTKEIRKLRKCEIRYVMAKYLTFWEYIKHNEKAMGILLAMITESYTQEERRMKEEPD